MTTKFPCRETMLRVYSRTDPNTISKQFEFELMNWIVNHGGRYEEDDSGKLCFVFDNENDAFEFKITWL